MNVAPAATFESVVAGFTSGLATVGVRIRDNAGADSVARTTVGVVEDIAGSGIYRKPNLVAPSTAGQYTIVWDSGGGSPVYSIEELVVTYSAVTGLTGPLYATEAELRSAMSTSGETFDAAEIQLALSSASRGIDAACSRRFYLDDDPSTRYYTANSIRRVWIDDAVTITAVAIDRNGSGTFGENWTTQYLLEPLNAAADSKPYEYLRVIDSTGWIFPLVDKGVSVTGTFGWPAVPDRIKLATMILAQKELLRLRQAPLGFQAFPGETGASVVRIAMNDPQIAPIILEFQRGIPFL